VLLLDEPTSGLDAASERAVLDALDRAAEGRTVVAVSHRLSLAARADRVVVLDGGRVVEQGPPGELLAAGGAYARLWGLQHPHELALTGGSGEMTCTGTPSGSSTMLVLKACWRSSKEVPMAIIGGLDVHRSQITYDWIDRDSGQHQRGRLAPAHREHLRAWLGQFAGQQATFALEGCTGWRYVVEELQRAGIAAQLAEPADTSALRGPKRRAKTDQLDARHLRQLLETGRLPRSWIPPTHVLEARTQVRLYKALREEHTAWLQRIHATLFHHGVPAERNLLAPARRAQLERGSGLSPAAHQLVMVALGTVDHLDAELERLRVELVGLARRQVGCRALAGLYGIGPVTAVAIWAELGDVGRFSSARFAVRHAGLDITVYSSDGKRTPGKLARQGPPVLRWALFEAATCAARASSPDHAYYRQVKQRLGGNRATLAVARKLARRCYHTLAALGDAALAPVGTDLGQVA
jgi:transposase